MHHSVQRLVISNDPTRSMAQTRWEQMHWPSQEMKQWGTQTILWALTRAWRLKKRAPSNKRDWEVSPKYNLRECPTKGWRLVCHKRWEFSHRHSKVSHSLRKTCPKRLKKATQHSQRQAPIREERSIKESKPRLCYLPQATFTVRANKVEPLQEAKRLPKWWLSHPRIRWQWAPQVRQVRAQFKWKTSRPSPRSEAK